LWGEELNWRRRKERERGGGSNKLRVRGGVFDEVKLAVHSQFDYL
jgi:hypothetical protein